MYSLSTQFLKTWCLVAASRAAEVEADRIAAEVEATRIAEKIEVDMIAVDDEAARIAAAIARIARRDAYIAADIEPARLSAAESASAHCPVEQSKECKQAERDRHKFVMSMIFIHDIWYLKGKTADKSPPHQALPARAAKLLGKVIRFDAAHYAPASQGEKSFTDPRTGGPTCKTNKIIYDAIYASLPDDCKLTFAQMFENFDDLYPFKAPLYVKGEKFDFEKHVLNLLTDEERAEWWHLTVNHLKWKYIDAIKNGVKKAILFVFGRLPEKYWPAKHEEALQMAREHILDTEGQVVEFTLEIVTCDHISSLFFGREDKVIVEMQEAVKKSLGGILEGRTVDHLMLNYNRAKIIIREGRAVNAMLSFW
jgi:phosphoribosylformylglycinamidine (FGAM) synthase PurS component